LCRGYADFREFYKGEVRRILILGSRVNKPPVNAPDPSGWHHAHGVDPPKETQVDKEEQAAVSSVAEQNKALVRRFYEAQAKGDLDTVGELLAPDFVDHSLLPGQDPGREGYIRSTAEVTAAFSDIRFIFDYQATDGDEMVISRLTTRSILDRGLFGMRPTGGKERVFPVIVIDRIVGGKIVEEWSANTVAPFLEELQQEIRERERVEQELEVARRIQQASLPKEVPTLEGWQIAPFYQPAREVGGDFYDFHLLSEGRLGLAVGDATGKGVPAALVMSTTCGMLRLAAQSYSSPGQMLQRVNEALFPYIPANMFVTCFYAILDPNSASLSYANAGHDLPYVRRGGECEELRARGMPLGLMPQMSYEEKDVTLDAVAGVLLYSDGLVEAHDQRGEMFGFPRLRALVAEHGEDRSLEDFLMEELYSFVGEGWEQEDDITLLTLRRSASLS
jgi:serine phosphatase RsbU (regulator of sigma subunit)/predicted ester cyclase